MNNNQTPSGSDEKSSDTLSTETSSDQKPPYIATFFALISVCILVSLGTWQLQRAEQKESRLAQIEQRKSDSVLSLQYVLQQEDPRDLSYQISGDLLTEQVFLLDNRIEAGKVGFHVIVPLLTDYGVQMINFGWIKAGQYRNDLPAILLNPNTREFTGTSSVPSFNPMVTETALATDPWPKVVQSIDLTVMAVFLGRDLLPVVMQLDPEHPDGFTRNWKAVVMAPEKHYGYAIQWYGLAIACLIIYIVALRKRKSN